MLHHIIITIISEFLPELFFSLPFVGLRGPGVREVWDTLLVGFSGR